MALYSIAKAGMLREYSPEDVEKIKRSYGIIWDTTNDASKKILGLHLITREGYIRKNLKVNHGIPTTDASD